MDANGTRFHLLLGRADWAACSADGVTELAAAWDASPPGDVPLAWDPKRSELTLKPVQFEFVAAPNDKPPALSDRRGAARDRYGNWYWIGASEREILVQSAGSGETSRFWPSADVPPPSPSATTALRTFDVGAFGPLHPPAPLPAMRLAGLAVTTEHYLIVGVLEPAGLLRFDLHGGGAPDQLLWPVHAGIDFVPFDVAPAPDGGAWILDRNNRRYWALDRQFGVKIADQPLVELAAGGSDPFQPVEGGEERRMAGRSYPGGIALGAASPVAALTPIAIEGLPDGSVLILDAGSADGPSTVQRYRFGQMLGDPAAVAVRGHDFALVPTQEGAELRLYVAGASGNQAYAYTVVMRGDGWGLRPVDPPVYLPMRLFGGKALVGAGGEAYYDFGDGWVPLVEQRRPRYVEEGTLYTPGWVHASLPSTRADGLRPALDGREPGCVWHRLLLDACIPPGAEVSVWSRAADDARELALTNWQPEPPLYRRGDRSELPFLPAMTGDGAGTWELLFQRTRGRYLQLKLVMKGNRQRTPRLHALRAYYPRFSYLRQYLPAVYREDAPSASFLDRYLANLEGLSTTLEDKIAAVQILFDVRSAPADVLEWLASWYGVALDPAWDEARRRLFIRNAMTFFQYRGTVPGLLMALR